MDKNKLITEITARLCSQSNFSASSGAVKMMVKGFLKMNNDELGSLYAVVVLGFIKEGKNHEKD